MKARIQHSCHRVCSFCSTVTCSVDCSINYTFCLSWSTILAGARNAGISGVQVLSRRLVSAPHKLIATSADTRAVQTAACACLAAAFGTKTAFQSVATLLCAPSLPAAAPAPTGQNTLITHLLELSCSGLFFLKLVGWQTVPASASVLGLIFAVF